MTTDDSPGEVELKVCYSHGCDNRFEPTGGTFETRALCPECREAQEKHRYAPQRPPRLIDHHIFYPDGYWRQGEITWQSPSST